MTVKEKIDIIGKKIEIIKAKTLGFMAIAGGAFISALKDIDTFLKLGIWVVFTFSVIGILYNFSNFSKLYKELEGIEK